MEVFKQIQNGMKLVKATRQQYETAIANVDYIINDICDFDAQLTYCAGDEHLVMNTDTASVAKIECLKGKTSKNKLTAKEHYEVSI